MAGSQVISIRAVAAAEADAVASLTWGAYRSVLSMNRDADLEAARPCCFAAWNGDNPVGLLVSAVSKEHKREEGWQSLLSLTVAPSWRRCGIARQLLTALETDLVDHAVGSLAAQYSDRLPEAQAFGQLLISAGWAEPSATRYRICGEVRDTAALFRNRDNLLKRLAGGGFRVHSWRERGEEGARFADAVIAQGGAPDWARPAIWDKTLDPDLSLVITDSGERPAGWVICEYQPQMSRLYFPIGWMVPPYDARGWLLGAYAVGALRAGEKYGESVLAVIETGSTQQGMWRVFERSFQPHARWTDRLMTSTRGLAADPVRTINRG